jgi:hypothetical protein
VADFYLEKKQSFTKGGGFLPGESRVYKGWRIFPGQSRDLQWVAGFNLENAEFLFERACFRE